MNQQSSKRVLLVDTRPESLFAFANQLGELGYPIAVASGVDQAMDIGERQAFDLVVCNVPLDFAEPFHLLRFLRRRTHLRGLRMVIRDACQRAGVRLTNVVGEPIYSISDELPIEAVRCILSRAGELPHAFERLSTETTHASKFAPHFDPSGNSQLISGHLTLHRDQ